MDSSIELLELISSIEGNDQVEIKFSHKYLLEVPTEIGRLQNLSKLDLSYNSLIGLPKEIGQLTNLNILDLRFNAIEFLPDELANLKKLKVLNLSANPLTNIPGVVFELNNIEELYLDNNFLLKIPLELYKLKSLRILSLGQNKILRIPVGISNLTKLNYLNLESNKLSTIPSELSNLQDLNILLLKENEINYFPEKIGLLSSLLTLDLTKNPLILPPQEIVQSDISSIREYYREISKSGTDYIYEAKLLILGEPGAGKTSLSRKILDSNCPLPKEEETTRGIDIHKWIFEGIIRNQETIKRPILVNIWDFGGQSIYKSTHRFFLTHRSCYIIVADARKENTDFFYWSHIVELFGEDSPLFLIINEKQNRKKDFEYNRLKARFPNLNNKHEFNLDDIDLRFDRFKNELELRISQLNHIGSPVPATWKQLREKMTELEIAKPVIPKSEFRKLCVEYDIVDVKKQNIVCDFFHDLGIFLNFSNDDILDKTIFLNKEWILDGIYSILDNKLIINNEGQFTKKDIIDIVSDEYYDFIPELVAIMKKFHLAYEKGNFIITPQLLPFNSPSYTWDSKDNIYFKFVYEDFMPFGILWQFIVEMNRYIYENKVWRYGVLLLINNAVAEIIEYYEKAEITIRVVGPNKDDVRAVIIQKLEEIHDVYKKLKTKKLVPCVCDLCQKSKDPYSFEYNTIMSAKNNYTNKVEYLQCLKSYKNVAITKLLNGFEFLVEDSAKRYFYTGRNVSVTINNNINYVSDSNKDTLSEPPETPFYKRKWFKILMSIITAIGAIIAWILSRLIDMKELGK